MIREHLFHKRAPADPDFRWRGGDVSRVEAISDGVFAITITLLIVSTTVPDVFYDIWIMVRDLPAFIASFAIIMMAWHYHHIFFRRFGLEDFLTSVINSIFLFLIMFLAYPLKFLSLFLWYLIIGVDIDALFAIPESGVLGMIAEGQSITEFWQRKAMMYFYGGGIIGVFGLLAILEWRAFSLRKQLELDELEGFLTLRSISHHLLTVIIATISLTVLYFTENPGYSGVVYFLMPFTHGGLGWIGGVRKEKIKQRLTVNPDGIK